jgi:cytidine deaminase
MKYFKIIKIDILKVYECSSPKCTPCTFCLEMIREKKLGTNLLFSSELKFDVSSCGHIIYQNDRLDEIFSNLNFN